MRVGPSMSYRAVGLAILMLGALMLSEAPAFAQMAGASFNNPWSARPIGRAVSFASAAPVPQPKAPGEYSVHVFGGLLTGYGDLGVTAGVGVGTRPLENEQIEVEIDALVGRTSQAFASDLTAYTTTVVAASGNVLYHVSTQMPFAPYAGGGLVVSRASLSLGSRLLDETFDLAVSGTFVTAQLIGGVERQFGRGKSFRAEGRFGVASFGGSALLLAGVSF